MGVIYAFNYAAWLAVYPEFSSPGGSTPVTSDQANAYFGIATSLQVNDGSGPVSSAVQQAAMLNALTAHIAALFSTPAGSPSPSPLVGRISSATEGSVSVTAEWAAQVSDNEAFYLQTKYGALYWQMRKAFLTMRYVPKRIGGPVPGYGGLI